MVVERPLTGVIVVNLFKEVTVEVAPFLEGKTLTEDARSDVLSDKSRLNEQSTRTAHKIVEVRLAFPSREEQHTCRKCLVERCFGLRYAVAALVERFAAAIKRQSDLPVSYMHIDIQVGVGQIDVGTLALPLRPIVGNGILDAISDVLGMAELLTINRGVNSERGPDSHPLAPVHLLGLLIDFVGICSLKSKNRHQDS